MKFYGYIAVFLFLAGSVIASNVSTSTPKKTVEWTATAASSVTIPFVDFSKGVPLEQALKFIKSMQSGPAESHPELSCRYGGNFDQSTLVHAKRKDITLLRAASLIADEIGAQLLIEPGALVLAPMGANHSADMNTGSTKSKVKINLPIHLNELTLVDGKTYKKVVITALNSNGVSISHQGGFARIPPGKLRYELHKQLGYTDKADGHRIDLKVRTGKIYRDALIKKIQATNIFIEHDGELIYLEKSILTADSLKALEAIK